MNLVKTNVRNRLSNDSLNSVLQIRVYGISMQNFHNVFVDKCIQNWYNTENCCLQQKNVKHTKKRDREKQKDYILMLVTYLHLHAIRIPVSK